MVSLFFWWVCLIGGGDWRLLVMLFWCVLLWWLCALSWWFKVVVRFVCFRCWFWGLFVDFSGDVFWGLGLIVPGC